MNKTLKNLFLFNGIFFFAASLVGPLFAIYVEKMQKSILAISTAWAVFLISTTVFTYVMFLWGDEVKKKKMFLIIGYIIRILTWSSLIFVHDYNSLLLVLLIMGVGEAVGTPAYDAIVAEHLNKDGHIKVYSFSKILGNLSSAGAAVLGGFIASRYGFNYLFMLMTFLACISLVGIVRMPKNLLK